MERPSAPKGLWIQNVGGHEGRMGRGAGGGNGDEEGQGKREK